LVPTLNTAQPDSVADFVKPVCAKQLLQHAMKQGVFPVTAVAQHLDYALLLSRNWFSVVG
jgi:hypothetical protein